MLIRLKQDSCNVKEMKERNQWWNERTAEVVLPRWTQDLMDP